MARRRKPPDIKKRELAARQAAQRAVVEKLLQQPLAPRRAPYVRPSADELLERLDLIYDTAMRLYPPALCDATAP